MLPEGEVVAGYRIERMAYPRTSVTGYVAVAEGPVAEGASAAGAAGERVVLWVLESPDADARQRFTANARATAGLAAPHTTRFLDAGETGERAWVAMTYVDAFTGRQWLHHYGPLGEALAATVAATLAETVDGLRLQSVRHGQVNASAILISPDDHPVITLAGLGIVDPAEPTTDDRFGLAAAMAELLTGVPRGRVAQHRPGLPEAVDAVLDRGLDPVPQQRYASAVEFARELGNALRSRREEPTRMGPEHDVIPTRSFPAPTTAIPVPPAPITDLTPSAPSQAYSRLPSGPTELIPAGPGPAAPPGSGHTPSAPGYPQPGYSQQWPPPPGPGAPAPGAAAPGTPASPKRSRRLLWVALAVVVVLAAIGGTLAVWRPWAAGEGDQNAGPTSAPAAGPGTRTGGAGGTSAAPSGPDPADYPGGCIPGAPPAPGSLDDDLTAGRLSIPEADLPASSRWSGSRTFTVPLAAESVQLAARRPAGADWYATLTVGELYPRVTGSPETLARQLLACLPDTAGYRSARASAPGNVRVQTRHLDDLDVDYAVATAIIQTDGAPVEVGGDDLQLIVVGTEPVVFALGTSPFEDDTTYDEIGAAIDSARVSAR